MGFELGQLSTYLLPSINYILYIYTLSLCILYCIFKSSMFFVFAVFICIFYISLQMFYFLLLSCVIADFKIKLAF